MLNLLGFKKISRPVGPDHGEASLGYNLILFQFGHINIFLLNQQT